MPVGEKAPRSQRESVQRWEVGPAAKELFNATFSAILQRPEVAEILFQDRLARKIDRKHQSRENETNNPGFTVRLGATLWEISGKLGEPFPEAEQELRLQKMDPNNPTSPVEGYSVKFFTETKKGHHDTNAHYGDVEYQYVDGSQMQFTRTILEASCRLLQEFSGEKVGILPNPVRDRIIGAWKNRRELKNR